MLGYTPFPDGARLDTVRNKLNSFNDSVVLEVNNLIQEVTNQGNRITTNEINIAQLRVDVDNIETIVDYYEYEEYSNVDVPSDSYTEVGSLHRTDVPDGTYEVKLLGTYSYDNTNSSAYLRVSLDNGSSWMEFRREPKDKTDLEAISFILPVSISSGIADVVVEGKKENAGSVFTIQRLDIVLDKKK
jgi:hypothetical protein